MGKEINTASETDKGKEHRALFLNGGLPEFDHLSLSPYELINSYYWGWFHLVFKSETIVTWYTDTIFFMILK